MGILDKKSDLVPGMFVNGRIILEDKKSTALPTEAITVDKGLHYIFIEEEIHDDETHFRKVQILKGNTDQGFVEVTPLETLPTETKIVTKGAYFLMAESKKGEEGAGHHH